jgi:hypothetical protein
MQATSNGRTRKSLAEQIDRLDQTLDGLADALNASIATAVREAVHAVIVELLADGTLRTRLQAASTVPVAVVPAQPAPSRLRDGCRRVWLGLSAQVRAVRAAVRGLVVQTCGVCSRLVGRLHRATAAAWQRTRDAAVAGWYAVRLLRHIGIALAVGGSVGVAAYCAGPTLAAAASGLCSFVAALTVRADLWLRQRLFRVSRTEETLA